MLHRKPNPLLAGLSPEEKDRLIRVMEASRIARFEESRGRGWSDPEAARIVDEALARLEAVDEDAWRMLL